jgi:signal peptidase II
VSATEPLRPAADSGSGARASAASSSACGSALLHVPSQLRFWLLAIGGIALDLGSKEWAFHTLRQAGAPLVLIPHVLSFQLMFNPGALFGIGHGQTALFLGASIVALGLVLWMFAQSAPRNRALHIALGGIVAGALGNMYDRVYIQLVPYPVPFTVATRYYERIDEDGATILREYPFAATKSERRLTGDLRQRVPETLGYVRDFIKINSTIGGRELWPWVFNVADMLLVGGVAILAIQLLRERRSQAVPATADCRGAAVSDPTVDAGAAPDTFARTPVTRREADVPAGEPAAEAAGFGGPADRSGAVPPASGRSNSLDSPAGRA